MKSLSIPPRLLRILFFFAVISCGGAGDQPGDGNTDSSAAAGKGDSAITLKSSPIVTTPQYMMIITHKVADYDRWQTSYEEHDSARLASQVHSYVIGRSATDRTMIFVAMKFDDLEKGRAFGKSADLKARMRKAGVSGSAKIRLTNMTWQDTSKSSTNLRSMTTFTVKDWDSWQRSFESSRPIRENNGLADRAYGHDADDNKKVLVVVAVTDTAKAYAFWKSDQLKDLRQKSGVTSEPERFNFRIVKRYD